MYDGNPREIDFGLSSQGFELLGVSCAMLKNKQNKSSVNGENY